VRGDTIDIFPAHYEDRAWRVNMFGDTIESIEEFDPLTGHKQDELEFIKIYANSHYVTPRPTLIQAIKGIKTELKWRLDQLNAQGRLLEAQRLEQRTTFDLEMMEATGSCAGIETIRAISPAASRASRRRRCSNMSPTTRWCSRTKAMSAFRRSAPCSKATSAARRRSPNTASACRPAWTIARSVSRSGT
jgi:hypothetical protein